MPRDRCGNVRESRAWPDRAEARATERKYRNLLARVIGAAPGRIAAMVGSDDEKIVRFQTRQQVGQPVVERFQGGGIPHDVAAMAVVGIEIDEVRKQKPAVL